MSSLKNRIIGIINVLVRYMPFVIRLANSEAAGMSGVLSFILSPIRPGRTNHAPRASMPESLLVTYTHAHLAFVRGDLSHFLLAHRSSDQSMIPHLDVGCLSSMLSFGEPCSLFVRVFA